MRSLAIVLFLAGCSTTPPAVSYCAIASPIIIEPSDVEVISDFLVAQLLAHNEVGAKLCGWGR